MARTGRRPGNQDTKEAILTAAREAFAAHGFDGASIRTIATSAGVDPALVHHYFGSKNQLFVAAMNLPADPAELIPTVFNGDPDLLGERIVRAVLMLWDSPAGAAAAALLRSAVQREWTARLMREFLLAQILRHVRKLTNLDPQDSDLRASLVVSQILGLVMTRYIIQIEPLASASPDLVVRIIGPTIQRYIANPMVRLSTDPPPPFPDGTK